MNIYALLSSEQRDRRRPGGITTTTQTQSPSKWKMVPLKGKKKLAYLSERSLGGHPRLRGEGTPREDRAPKKGKEKPT